MSLNLKNPETARLIRELADATGESMTQAVTTAVRERLHRLRAGDAERSERVWAIVRELRARLPDGYLDQDFDDLLYDPATGLPR
jgi:antitoxin VapB